MSCMDWLVSTLFVRLFYRAIELEIHSAFYTKRTLMVAALGKHFWPGVLILVLQADLPAH